MGYTVHGILQARILEWVAFPFYRGSSRPRNQTQVSPLAGRILYHLRHQGSPCALRLLPIFSMVFLYEGPCYLFALSLVHQRAVTTFLPVLHGKLADALSFGDSLCEQT